MSGVVALERHTATLPDEEVQEEAELRQEKEDGTASMKQPTTGGDFTPNYVAKPRPPAMNGLHENGNPATTEVVPLANGDDPHVDPNDPHFLIPPKFSEHGDNPPVQNGLPINGITHPHAVPVPPHVHVDSQSPDLTHAQPAQPTQPQPSGTTSRRSLELINQMTRGGGSRKSLDLTGGSRKNMKHSSKGKLGTGMSLSQMISQKQLQTGSGAPAGGEKGMVLPFDPLYLTFHDLNYFVPLPRVQLLSNFVTLCQG